MTGAFANIAVLSLSPMISPQIAIVGVNLPASSKIPNVPITRKLRDRAIRRPAISSIASRSAPNSSTSKITSQLLMGLTICF